MHHPIALDVVGLVAILILVGLNAFFVAAEYSLVTVRWTRVEELMAQRKFGARAVQHAIEHLDDAIASSQLGVTFSSLGVGWLGEPALAHLVEPLFARLPFGEYATHIVAVTLAFLLISFFHVVLGEIAPKSLALDRAEAVALVVAGPLLTFGRVFRPLTVAMKVSGKKVVDMLKLPPPPPGQEVHSVEELGMLVEETQEAGILSEEHASYVQNVFELTDKVVCDVMVPREKVVTLNLQASEEKILDTARETAHTRMPVWEDSPDHIVGIVNTKNLFHVFSVRGLVLLEDAMYPPTFVPPEMPVHRALRMFRRTRRPMAVVMSADSKFMGIVTLEDILEEIVGEIEDEHDIPTAAGSAPPGAPTTGDAGGKDAAVASPLAAGPIVEGTPARTPPGSAPERPGAASGPRDPRGPDVAGRTDPPGRGTS